MSSPGSVTPERIQQIAWGYVPTLVLEAAIQHRVFDVLDSGPKTLPEIQQETGASERGLTAIVNVLVGLNFPPGSDFFRKFVNDIFPMSYPAAQTLAANLDMGESGLVRVLDLAAGSGVWGIALAQRSERVRVTAVDWPQVIPVTRETVQRYGLADRFSFIEGDLLEADFGGGYTVATLGQILHSEGRERSRALLTKTCDALSPGGTIAIAEFLVNPDRTGPLNGLFFAVNMLVNTDSGDTYSFEEIAAWLAEAGFVNARQLESPGPSPLILATKP